jgi:hypothetical protein
MTSKNVKPDIIKYTIESGSVWHYVTKWVNGIGQSCIVSCDKEQAIYLIKKMKEKDKRDKNTT